MKLAQLPKNEQEVLKAQQEFYLPDTVTEADFSDIAAVAMAICQKPAAIFLVSPAGKIVHAHNGKLPEAFAVFVANTKDVLLVPDLSKDKRFATDDFAPAGVLSYFLASFPVTSNDDFLGALCITDQKPGTLDDKQVAALQALCRQTGGQIALKALAEKQAGFASAFGDLAKIAHIASHDLKSPLNNIISLTHLLKDDYGNGLDEAGNEYVNYLNDASYQLLDLCNGILNFARTAQATADNMEDIDLADLAEEALMFLNVPAHVSVDHSSVSGTIHTKKVALRQIFSHLIQNSIKYIDATPVQINVTCSEDKAYWYVNVKDNSTNIAREEKEKTYKLFNAPPVKPEQYDNLGIDLAIARRLAEKLGGGLSVDPQFAGSGMSFTARIPK